MAIGIGSVLKLHPAGFALSQMASAIKGMYNMVGDVNDYVDGHLEQMKKSENATISKTGTVIERAKFGFGLGYMSSIAIIATGQLLLGNTLSAVATAATAVTMTNPIAMTCAAVGAIYYGWGALSTAEQDAILDKLRKGLEIGVETIKAIIAFVIRVTKEVLSPENIAEFKAFIKTYAGKFGKSLSDVTGKMLDILKDAADSTVKVSTEFYESTTVVLSGVATQTSIAASNAAGATSTAAKSALVSTSLLIESTTTVVKGAMNKAGDAAAGVAEAASTSAKELYEKTTDAASKLRSSKPKVVDRTDVALGAPDNATVATDQSPPKA